MVQTDTELGIEDREREGGKDKAESEKHDKKVNKYGNTLISLRLKIKSKLFYSVVFFLL